MVAEQIPYAASGSDWCVVLMVAIVLLLITGVTVVGYRFIADYRKKTDLA
jgi:hypothetical protein